MDQQAVYLIAPDLDANEEVLWSGRPDPLGLAIAKSWPVAVVAFLLFSLGLSGITFSGMGGGPVSRAIIDALGFFSPVLMIFGLGLAIIPFLRLYQAQGTVYALTDQRALIVSHFPYRTALSITPNRIAFVRRRERTDGTSDVMFAEHIVRGGEPGVLLRREGFYGIADGPFVDRLIRRRFLANAQTPAAPGASYGPWTGQRAGER